MERNRMWSRVRSRVWGFVVGVALLAGLSAPATVHAQEGGPAVLADSAAVLRALGEPSGNGTYVAERRPWFAAGEVFATNLVVWVYDRYIRENGTNPGFRIGINSFEENIQNGFEYDDNNFATNMYAHPYHGNLYFNAARSNAWSLWFGTRRWLILRLRLRIGRRRG